jgi:hypothetical protein
MFRQHGCSKVKMWTRTMQGACQNLREWTPILRVERGEPLVWDMSVVRFVNLPKVGFYGRDGDWRHDPRNAWRGDFTCRFFADENLDTHATQYSENCTNTLCCPPLTSAESWSHLNLTSWIGDLGLHYIHDGEIFAVSGQRYMLPRALHTVSLYSNNQKHRHRDRAVPPNSDSADQRALGTRACPPFLASRTVHTGTFRVPLSDTGDLAGGRTS